MDKINELLTIQQKSLKNSNMSKIKVLYFVDLLSPGGIQSLCYDIVKYINRDRFIMDILILDDGQHYALEDTIAEIGVKIYKLRGINLVKPRDFFPYIKAVKRFFIEHNDYNAVHMNSSSKNVWILYYAKKVGIPIRIAHSHNTNYQQRNILVKFVGSIFKFLLEKVSTHYFACSTMAGEWMFGKKAVIDNKVKIIKNGIAVNDFLFNAEWRKTLRAQLHIEDNFVIGNIGRFTTQKNQKFLIDILYELKKTKQNVCLLFLGAGELENQLKAHAHSLGLDDDVIFLGFRTDRNKWLSAMDAFVLTSIFEGLGIVIIEAQAAGLPSFATQGIVPEEANISPLLNYLPPKSTPSTWAKKILSVQHVQRQNMLDYVKNAGYDIKQVIKELELIYSEKR